MDTNLEAAAKRFLKLASRLRRLGPGNTLPEGLAASPSQMSLIEYAASNPDCGIQEMAKALNLSTPTVSIGVRQLEKEGFIARKPNPKDGRAVHLFLTTEGKEIHRRAHTFQHTKIKKLLSGLTPEERETLVCLLEQAINNAETEA